MKKHFLNSILCLLLAVSALGQTPYLNSIDSHAGALNLSMVTTDSSYVFADRRNNSSWKTIDFTRFDKTGALVDSLSISDSTWTLGNRPKTLHFRNGSLYYANTNFLGIRSSEIIFFTVKGNLDDSIKTKTFIERDTFQFNGTSWIVSGQDVWATQFDSDSTFVLTGIQTRKGFIAPDSVLKFDVFVAKFDTAYNLLWSTVIPEIDQNRGQDGPIGCDIELDAYGSLIVSGNPFYYAPTQMGFVARLRQSDGHLFWYKEYPGGQFGLSGMYCVDNGNGTYQFVQNWVTDPTGSNHQLNIGVMDTLGNVLQQKRYLDSSYQHAAVDLISTSDGNYYAAGISYFNEFFSFGFKFTPSLDSLFAIDLYYDQIGNRSEIFNFQEEPSGGYIIHGGMYIGSSAPGVNSWLKRIDLQGCDTSNCGIGIRENPSQGSIVFYPNPADNQLTLKWEPSTFYSSIQITVFDMTGRALIDREVADRTLGMEILDVSTLIPGTYILQLSTDDGFLTSETLMIY